MKKYVFSNARQNQEDADHPVAAGKAKNFRQRQDTVNREYARPQNRRSNASRATSRGRGECICLPGTRAEHQRPQAKAQIEDRPGKTKCLVIQRNRSYAKTHHGRGEKKMNCKSQNRLDFVEVRLRNWADIARNTNDQRVRARARKNLTNLIKGYPGVAESLGFSIEVLTTK